MARDVVVERTGTERRNLTHTGPARIFALVFGIAYLGVALAEVYLRYVGETFEINGQPVLAFSLMHNIVHWVLGLAFLLAGLMREWNAKAIVGGLGLLFVLIGILGFVAPEAVGSLLGHDGRIPALYNWVHLVSGAVALLASFLSPKHVGMRRYERA